jgi:hypothetical protein
MSQIVDMQITHDSGGASRRITYAITLEDNMGQREVVDVGPIIAGATFDATADLAVKANQALTKRIRLEIEGDIEAMESGTNPLRDEIGDPVPTRWATYAQVVGAALKYFLSHEDPTVTAKSAPMIDNLTDGQIMGLLGVDADTVAQIRSLAATWGGVGDQIKSYTPIL